MQVERYRKNFAIERRHFCTRMTVIFEQWVNYWTIGLLTVIIVIVYVYVKRHHSYFQKMGIPYIESHILVGNRGPVVFKQRSLFDHSQVLYNSIPDAKYVGIYDFAIPAILIRDVELIKDVGVKHSENFLNHKILSDPQLDPLFANNLFNLQNDKWRKMRALLTPAFTSSKMKMMFDMITKCATDFADFIEKQSPIVVDVKDGFARYTNDVIAGAAFGITVNSMKERNNEFYLMGKEATTSGFVELMKMILYQASPTLAKKLKANVVSHRAVNYFCNIIESTIATRKTQGIQRSDMIQLLMEAKDSGDKLDLTIEDITAQAFIFFFAGFDTSSSTMSFAAYSLATNPEIQKKVQAEVDDILKKCNGKVTYEHLKEMKYLEAVVSETLRLYPAAAEIDRVCSKTFELPPARPAARSVTVKPGTVILFPVYAIHRDPQYHPNPDKFDPDRFLNENEKINPLAYFPFGLGPRYCIGTRFALMEVKLVLFYLLMQCNFEPCEKTTIPMKFSTANFLPRPLNGHWLKIVPRKGIKRL
uniref:Cytochrome P450-15 n=1 Tax=Cephus cinctus TaxID=211228 RepID=A0A1W6L1G4_CEPCN|nr:cytochrome P450-15 [Cephus cinctus]